MTSSGEVSPASVTPAGTPSLISQAPKYGTLIPNRIFVGGIAANTTEVELKQYFMAYGAVKDCKIIADRAGVSKGYGFVTFETQEDAEKIIKKEGDNLIFKDRKLNIGPAIRKQAFTRMYEQSVSPGTILFTNGVPYTYQNGMAVFHPQEGYPVPTTPQPAYPVMVPHGQPMYVSQPNFTYQSPTAAATATQWAAASPWRWTAPPSPATPTIAASQYMYPMQTVPPEVIYAQLPPQAAFQPGDIADGSVIETAPAEGSMVMDPSMVGMQPRYVEGIAPTVATMFTHAINASAAEYPTTLPATPTSIIPVTPKTGPVAYKRPMAPTPRKVLNTQSSVTYSPRATPPMKMAAMQGPGQRIITKTSNGTPISVITKDKSDTAETIEATLLTPPPTPQAKVTS